MSNAAPGIHVWASKKGGALCNHYLGNCARPRFSVREWTVYKTLSNSVKTEAEYQGIIFLSPSAVKSFFALNTPSSSILLFAIGETTAAEIKQFCKNRVLTGKQTSTESLVDRLIEEIQAVKTGNE